MSLHKTVAVSRQPQIHRLAQQVSQQVFTADSITEAPQVIETVNPDLILLDSRLGQDHIHPFLVSTDKITDAPVVVVGSSDDDPDAPSAFTEAGAYDYLPGPEDHHRLEEIADRIAKQPVHDTPGPAADDFFIDELTASVSMAGRSEAIEHTVKMIKLVAASRCNPILIVGRTGTGKELAAKAVHKLRHPNEPFIAVNCAALTANLLESELFGHVKGSFTGADREKTGLLELAGTGTLFLDEISEMPMDLQAKLLRILQERTFRKVGGIKDVESKATIIASSNRNLLKETRANRFRADLYYRLNISPIGLAPLNSPRRKQDIPLLTQYFLKTSTIDPAKSNKITSLTKLALEALQKYDWPGNVRELRNVIERAILYETTDKIGLSSIVIDTDQADGFTGGPTTGNIKDYSLAKAECELIRRALKETGWQKTRAASLLGITRATLYAKLKQYGIKKRPHAEAHTDTETSPEFPSELVTAAR